LILAQSGDRERASALALRHMKIRVDDPQLLDELVHHLRRSGCVATASDIEAHGDGITVDVQLPAALDEEQARMELELYLKVFQATHPGQVASLLA
jgi:hypothetical protein